MDKVIIIVMGLPGTGKTYFAAHLAADIQAQHISSDKTRSLMQKRGAYSDKDRGQVYREMLVEAEETLNYGKHVIMDATYSQKAHRHEVMTLAQRLDASVHFIRLTAEETTVKDRTSREREESEADFKVYQIIKQSFEPLEIPHLILDSTQLKIDEMLAMARHYITL
jgi:predicted kinase